ncbi:unnamed protein product [Lactuca virosa]|uniref:Transposase-associated domain-containing protein n=1 Tax=Lactuca virosa TaxID=75947 RepID=A0AAU9NRU9_9ASTR|nr:unnamed protein product [Lactuca virosa]
MDKSWISSNRLTNAYDEGVEDFLTFAQNNNVKSDVIPCPCINCINLCYHSIPTVRYHLFSNGFDEGYKVWTFHGENPERGPNKFVLPDFDHTKDMVDDAFFTDVEEEPDSLKTLVEECEKPLYEGSKYSALSGILKFQYLKGVPIGEEAKKLATFEGMVARTMVPITYETWRHVTEETKEDIWQYVLMSFVVDLKSRKNTLKSIGSKWRNFKHYLFKNFIKQHKNDPKAKLLDSPEMYPFLKKADWKLFVAQRLSKKWQEKSDGGKKICAHNKYNHRLSRKGYAGLTVEIMKETGKSEEEIDRSLLWKRARQTKKGGYDSNVQIIVDKIDKLQNSEDYGEVIFGTNDVLTQALGTEEHRGFKNLNQRFETLESEVQTLKRDRVNNVSEGASCVNNENFQDDPVEDLLYNSCYLAVDTASNIVAKGTITNISGETFEVLMDRFLNGEAWLPIPVEEEFIVKVKDAVGHILSWPQHLVIRCSDLEKVAAKPLNGVDNEVKKYEKRVKKCPQQEKDKYKQETPPKPLKGEEKKVRKEEKKVKKRQREENEKNKQEPPPIPLKGEERDVKKVEKKVKKCQKQEKEKNKQFDTPRMRTRGQKKERTRIETSQVLKLTSRIVDKLYILHQIHWKTNDNAQSELSDSTN